ncbi:MAG: hypothetical protein ABIH49_01550 [archaeon]
MAEETILQNWIFAKFILPFLLVFFIVFALLEKTKIFGDDKKQINALIAFVIGLIFVGFAYPRDIVQSLVLFLAVAIVVVFVILLLWGFSIGSTDVKISGNLAKVAAGVVVIGAVVVAVLWATGVIENYETIISQIENLFGNTFLQTFWVNALFIIIIALALAWVLKSAGGKSG